MKRLYLLTLFMISSLVMAYAQVETRHYEKGETNENIRKPKRKNIEMKSMPTFDLAAQFKKDADREQNYALFRFGKGFDVAYTLDDGHWEDSDDGRIWSMSIASEGALSLNFVFNNFYLPKGAEMYIVNDDETIVYGPITSEETTENGHYLTDIIPGSTASIYLYEPSDVKGLSTLTIIRVVHGYRNSIRSETNRASTDIVLGIDIACMPEYEQESDGVGLLVTSDGTAYCTGSLLMSTIFSFRGFFLTTYEFVDTDCNGVITDSEIADAQNCMVKFRSKYKECGLLNAATSYTYNQSYYRASWNNTKFALLEIKGNLASNTNLTWLGWKRTNLFSQGACLFHPTSGWMKYSDMLPVPLPPAFLGEYGWRVSGGDGILLDKGVGAPLFNQDKLLIGHVYRPYTYGTIPSSTNWTDCGKFWRSWEGGGTNSTRLSNWLDPLGYNWYEMGSYRPMKIIGPNKVISSSVYSVINAPDSLNVGWGIYDEYYNLYCLQENVPTQQQCTVTRSLTHDISSTTLHAFYSVNGTYYWVEKDIYFGNGFDGTYFNGVTTKQVDLPAPLDVLSGTTVVINSPDLIGSTVSIVGGNLSPTSWHLNSITGVLTVVMPSVNSGATVVNVTCPSGIVYTLPIVINSTTNLMQVLSVDGFMEVSITQQAEMCEEAVEHYNISSGSSIEKTWTLEIHNAMTGEKVFSKKVSGRSYNINTSDWKSGVYVVKVVVDNEVLSEKTVVK